MSTILAVNNTEAHRLSSNEFWLMHRDLKVALLQIDLDSGHITKILEINDESHVPLGARLSDKNFKRWWANRAIPTTRNGIQAALALLDITTTQNLLVLGLGLSLTDQYWVKPIDSTFTWEEVNLYCNEFSDTIGEFQFTGQEGYLELQAYTTFYPSSSLQGDLKKKWIIDANRDICLVKGNYGMSCQQSLNEVFATMLHKKQAVFPYTEYKLTQVKTSEGPSIGCMCKNFTSTGLEFIPAYEVSSSKTKANDVSEYEHFISICSRSGLLEEYVRKFLEYQILSDFIISNTDRHFNNFGVLRDPITLKFVSMAPIFDSGNSLFWNAPVVPAGLDLLKLSVTSFKKQEVDMLSYIQDRNVLDLTKLPTAEELSQLLEIESNLSETRHKAVLAAYKQKIEYTKMFQEGHNLKQSLYK